MTNTEKFAMNEVDNRVESLMRSHNKNMTDAGFIVMTMNNIGAETSDINVHKKIDKIKGILKDTFC